MKVSPKSARKRKPKQLGISADTQANNEIKMEMESTTSVIRNTRLEHMEIETIETPAATVVDEQHFIIDDNITVESNIEIEFITSDELIPSEMDADAETIDYDNSDKKYENDFVDEMSSQHDNEDYDGGNESWDNVSAVTVVLAKRVQLNWPKFCAGGLR